VVVCVCLIEEGGKTIQEIQTFITATPDRLALSDWLESFDERAGPEDRCDGLCQDRAASGAWASAGKLCAGETDSGFEKLPLHRKVLIQERSREANRLHQALQDSGIKLSSVVTNIPGVSGGP